MIWFLVQIFLNWENPIFLCPNEACTIWFSFQLYNRPKHAQNLKPWLVFDIFMILFWFFWFNWNKIQINDKNKIMTNGKDHGSGSCYKLSANIKSWAHLTKIASLGTFDFWQFYKKDQLYQCITSSILTLDMCSWTF